MDKKLSASAAAERAGIKRRTFMAYVARRGPRGAPAPDGREEVSGHPWWWESTIDGWLESRPGVPGRPRKAQPMPELP